MVAVPGPAVSDVPRLIVSDLDGTFLSPDGTVSAENRAAVAQASAAGIMVVFATGRPLRNLDIIRDLPTRQSIVIAGNGAILYDLSSGETLDIHPIPSAVALAVIADIRQQLPDAAFGIERGRTCGFEPSYQAPDAGGGNPLISTGTAEELIEAGDFVKILIQHPELPADALAREVDGINAGRLTITHSSAGLLAPLEVSASGVSKASMLQEYCTSQGIDAAEVAAFGDMPNDLEMLHWVGMPHVMANSHPAMLDLGVTVIAGNHQSGVGRTISGFLSR